ncbi:MAG TPA: recombinase family protein [Bacillota bacterium]|nr:recombinase family protein [Bacillota bacterium]
MQRVAIYIRVSTRLQEDRYSLSAQQEELTKYAQSQGWVIGKIYKDVDSGGKLDKKGLNLLLDDVEDGNIDIVLCIDQDRLSRLDTVAWEYLKSTLRDHGVKIAEPGSIVDLKNEDDEFISDIKNLIARREKKAIVRRMMRGKRQRTREGKGWGKPPWEYNYDKNTSQYSINETWSWIIPYIDKLYLHEGLSDHHIAKRLNEITKTPSGKPWNDVNIRQRLTNKAYHGVMEKKFSNGETITVPDTFPPLRSEETWEQIQQERKRRFRKRKEVYFSLLRRVNIVCGNCERKVTVKMSGTEQYSIHFYLKHGRAIKRKDQSVCSISINVIRVEKNIIQAIKDILTNEEVAKKYMKFDFTQKDIETAGNEIKASAKLIQDTQEKIDRLLDIYLEGGFSKDKLAQKKEELEKQLAVHQERQKELEAKKEAITAKLFNYDLVRSHLAIANRFDRLLSQEKQMELIGNLFPSGVLFEDRLELNGKIGDLPLDIIVPIDENPY